MAVDRIDPRPEIERAAQSEFGIERRRLVDQRDALAALDGPRGGAQKASGEADQARLARAIGAAQPQRVAAVQRQRQAFEQQPVAANTGDVVQPQQFSYATRARRRAHRPEEHTSELQSLMRISYAVLCLKK